MVKKWFGDLLALADTYISKNIIGQIFTIEIPLSRTFHQEKPKKEMKTVKNPVRHCIFQLIAMVELNLDPMPVEATQAHRQSLNWNDEFIENSRSYTISAYSIKAEYLERKGYMRKPEIIIFYHDDEC